ncbi:glycosyltransferase family 2 protein [Rufibacter psychrotolerans]|uniref:glycosyltransferase family 2 protein n=1 Tax=Rufibacter psychrotolerans TaxID=2812556 RepID=UPI0019686B10|nr:glycosyltransferase family A protein [Rufibacter sp. SYSU D00308]
MDTGLSIFEDVTLLITHYNRSNSLERLLRTYEELGCRFGEVVVSDDGSKPEHLQAIRQLQETYSFRLITSPVNKGLAHNLNKGQEAVKTPYTLYVQEDFVPLPAFKTHFPDALALMRQEQELDIVRFYAYSAYPYLTPYKKGYSRMSIKPWYTNYRKIYYYTDHPHLRRSTFLQKFGRYVEGIKSDKAEYLMCLSFIQKKGKGLFFNDFKSLFLQKNSAEEPSTIQRSSWRQSKSPLISLGRDIYRQVKYNFDIHFAR